MLSCVAQSSTSLLCIGGHLGSRKLCHIHHQMSLPRPSEDRLILCDVFPGPVLCVDMSDGASEEGMHSNRQSHWNCDLAPDPLENSVTVLFKRSRPRKCRQSCRVQDNKTSGNGLFFRRISETQSTLSTKKALEKPVADTHTWSFIVLALCHEGQCPVSPHLRQWPSHLQLFLELLK